MTRLQSKNGVVDVEVSRMSFASALFLGDKPATIGAIPNNREMEFACNEVAVVAFFLQNWVVSLLFGEFCRTLGLSVPFDCILGTSFINFIF